VDNPSTSSAVDSEQHDHVSPAAMMRSDDIPSTSSVVDSEHHDHICPTKVVSSADISATDCLLTPLSDATATSDTEVAEVSFYDIQSVPVRQRRTKCKRRPLPSSTLTSEEHFTFLSTKKPKPNPTKQKQKPNQMKQKQKSDAKKKINAKKKENKPKQSTSTTSEDCTPYLYCEILYNLSDVDWVQCKRCAGWACGDCAKLGARNSKKRKMPYVCDSCK